MNKPKSWLATVDSPVLSTKLVYLWETTSRRNVYKRSTSERSQMVVTGGNQQGKRTAALSPDQLSPTSEEDLESYILGQYSSRSLKSSQPAFPRLPFNPRPELFLSLRSRIAVKAGGLTPFSQLRTSRFHVSCDNPRVAQFMTRFEQKPAVKIARMGRRGFQPQKVLRKQPTRVKPTAEDSVEYLCLQPSK